MGSFLFVFIICGKSYSTLGLTKRANILGIKIYCNKVYSHLGIIFFPITTHETWNEFCVLFIIKLFLAKNDLKPVNLPPSYRGQNKTLTFDQVWSCYIQESFKGRTVLMKLMFSYLLWAIFYYWNFILNKYHYFRYFSRCLYKMSELLCVTFMPCVWLFILFQVCIFHDTILKSIVSQRDEFHMLKKTLVVYHLFLSAL